MLVHICCSVDSHFFLQKLQKLYPKEKLIGFFYDPNIHPFSEYSLRLLDVIRSCNKLGIELLVGEYDFENWFNDTKIFENEPEKGKRCDICFDKRLIESAKKALKIGEYKLTTTLFASPKKSFEQLSESLKKIGQEFGIDVLSPDFRKNGGTKEQFLLAKKDKLYHQNYCGCMFALNKQREIQKKVSDELMCPIGKEVLPNSIEERTELYQNVIKYEHESRNYELQRRRFLNYRILQGLVKFEDKVIPSYILFYSSFRKNYMKIRLENVDKTLTCKNEIIFLSLQKFNELAHASYKSTKELIFNAISVKIALHVRGLIDENPFSLSPIIVFDEIKNGKYEILIKSISYEDVREVLACI